MIGNDMVDSGSGKTLRAAMWVALGTIIFTCLVFWGCRREPVVVESEPLPEPVVVELAPVSEPMSVSDIVIETLAGEVARLQVDNDKLREAKCSKCEHTEASDE